MKKKGATEKDCQNLAEKTCKEDEEEGHDRVPQAGYDLFADILQPQARQVWLRLQQ